MTQLLSIYIDGACSGNPGPGGWAVYYCYENFGKLMHNSERDTTNNRMELVAAIKALEDLQTSSKIKIYTDSIYVKNGITEWIYGWIKNSWYNSKKEPVKNSDLWQKLLQLTEKHDIEWLWLKAHTTKVDSNSLGNYLVDDLSVRSRKRL
jgi:ribonuclease HI